MGSGNNSRGADGSTESVPSFRLTAISLLSGEHIEKLAPARAPLRILASTRRNLKLAARLRKRLDVDLVPARLVRLVGHPARRASGEKRPHDSLNRVRRYGLGLASGAGLPSGVIRKHPQVPLGAGSDFVDRGQAPVARPVGGILSVWRSGETLLVAGPARLLAKQVPRCAGAEHNRPAVGGPDWERRSARIGGEPAGQRRVPPPAATDRWPRDCHGPQTTRRPSGDRRNALTVLAWFAHHPQRLSGAVEPGELAQDVGSAVQQHPAGRDRDVHLTQDPDPGHRIGNRMRFPGESESGPCQTPGRPKSRRAATADSPCRRRQAHTARWCRWATAAPVPRVWRTKPHKCPCSRACRLGPSTRSGRLEAPAASDGSLRRARHRAW